MYFQNIGNLCYNFKYTLFYLTPVDPANAEIKSPKQFKLFEAIIITGAWQKAASLLFHKTNDPWLHIGHAAFDGIGTCWKICHINRHTVVTGNQHNGLHVYLAALHIQNTDIHFTYLRTGNIQFKVTGNNRVGCNAYNIKTFNCIIRLPIKILLRTFNG